jgi:hypothetical protein
LYGVLLSRPSNTNSSKTPATSAINAGNGIEITWGKNDAVEIYGTKKTSFSSAGVSVPVLASQAVYVTSKYQNG